MFANSLLRDVKRSCTQGPFSDGPQNWKSCLRWREKAHTAELGKRQHHQPQWCFLYGNFWFWKVKVQRVLKTSTKHSSGLKTIMENDGKTWMCLFSLSLFQPSIKQRSSRCLERHQHRKLQGEDLEEKPCSKSSPQEQALPWHQTIRSCFLAGNTTWRKKEEGWVLLSRGSFPHVPCLMKGTEAPPSCNSALKCFEEGFFL